MPDQPEQGAGSERSRPAEGEPSLVDELQQPTPMRYIKFAVAMFAVVGVGYGLTFWLFSELGNMGSTGGAFLVGIGSFFGLLLGPVVAVGTGAYTALNWEGEETKLVAAAAGVGAAAGYVVLVIVLLLFASLSSSGGAGCGGGGTSLPGGTGGTLGLLLGIAATATLTVYLTARVRIES